MKELGFGHHLIETGVSKIASIEVSHPLACHIIYGNPLVDPLCGLSYYVIGYGAVIGIGGYALLRGVGVLFNNDGPNSWFRRSANRIGLGGGLFAGSGVVVNIGIDYLTQLPPIFR